MHDLYRRSVSGKKKGHIIFFLFKSVMAIERESFRYWAGAKSLDKKPCCSIVDVLRMAAFQI